MKKEILNNLQKLYDESFSFIKGATVQKIITDYINETNQDYLNIGVANYLSDEEPIELSKLKENIELQRSFNKAIKLDIDEDRVVLKFKDDLRKAFSEIKLKFETQEKGIKNQAIFLEYDFLPVASISGYSRGQYPMLKEPEYLEFYPKEEI